MDNPDIPSFAELAADPEIAPLLTFTPVARKVIRHDGWTPDLQRELIARIAATGTLQQAVWQMGKHATGAEGLYKNPHAGDFRSAWDSAIAIGRRRNGLDSQPPFAGAVPGISRRWPKGAGAALPADDDTEEEMSEEHKRELLFSIGTKFMRKVAAERSARLNGEIVAADYYLRQVTHIEVMFDLASNTFGWNPRDILNDLRRGGHDARRIASTEFSDWLDRSRRLWWAQEGAPERPPHPDVRFLDPRHSSEGDYALPIDHRALGPASHPARGYSHDQWAALDHDQQRAARAEQNAADAEAQRAWEAQATADHQSRLGEQE